MWIHYSKPKRWPAMRSVTHQRAAWMPELTGGGGLAAGGGGLYVGGGGEGKVGGGGLSVCRVKSMRVHILS